MASSLNRKVLLVFGPVLILTGIGGFLLPPSLSLMSAAPAYNVFHIAFGALGAALALRGVEREIAAFNLGFGLLDLYQAVAHGAHLFPEAYFRWTVADDVLHVALGLGLAAVGLLAFRRAT
jgi:hypothetical protein